MIIERYTKPKKDPRKQERPVLQVNPVTGESIAEFENYRLASEITGIGHKNIHNVLKGRKHKTGGFGWVYKDEVTISNNEAREEIVNLFLNIPKKEKVKLLRKLVTLI